MGCTRCALLENELIQMRQTLEGNIPPRTHGSLQEEVDFLRGYVAALQVNKHNLIDRLKKLHDKHLHEVAAISAKCDEVLRAQTDVSNKAWAEIGRLRRSLEGKKL